MNVSKALMTAILRQLAKTLKEVSHALVTLDSLAMDFLASVNALFLCCINHAAMHMHYKAVEEYMI